MKFPARKLLLTVLAFGLLAGCAKQGAEDYDALEAQSLDAWMSANNDLSDPAFEKTSSGLYIYWIKKVDRTPTDTLVKVGDWVKIDYTGKTLQGDVFYTRVANVARRQGTFSRRTHYVSNLLYMNAPNNTMAKGMYEALQKMTVGDMVRLYMPSKLYNGSSGYTMNNIGYNGQWGLDGSKPAVIDSLTVLERGTNPIIDENAAVKKIAQDWGLDIEKPFRDSTGFYLALQSPFPFKRDSIAPAATDTTTFSFYYKTTFLDGFVIDSNIDSVQMRAWGEVTNSGPKRWKLAAKADGTYYYEGTAALRSACSSACYGDRLKFVVTSAYAYGIAGKSGTYSETKSSSTNNAYADYLNQMNYYSYLNSMSYGGYGYGNLYNNYYNSGYYNNIYNNSSSSSSTSATEDETVKVSITTEILPFSPLIYEVWIVPSDGSGSKPDSNTE